MILPHRVSAHLINLDTLVLDEIQDMIMELVIMIVLKYIRSVYSNDTVPSIWCLFGWKLFAAGQAKITLESDR